MALSSFLALSRFFNLPLDSQNGHFSLVSLSILTRERVPVYAIACARTCVKGVITSSAMSGRWLGMLATATALDCCDDTVGSKLPVVKLSVSDCFVPTAFSRRREGLSLLLVLSFSSFLRLGCTFSGMSLLLLFMCCVAVAGSNWKYACLSDSLPSENKRSIIESPDVLRRESVFVLRLQLRLQFAACV